MSACFPAAFCFLFSKSALWKESSTGRFSVSFFCGLPRSSNWPFTLYPLRAPHRLPSPAPGAPFLPCPTFHAWTHPHLACFGTAF